MPRIRALAVAPVDTGDPTGASIRTILFFCDENRNAPLIVGGCTYVGGLSIRSTAAAPGSGS